MGTVGIREGARGLTGFGVIPTTSYVEILQPAFAGGPTPTLLKMTPGAHTALPAGTECVDVELVGRDVEFAAGAIAEQRTVKLGGQRYKAIAATVITSAATLWVQAPVTGGANVTITDRWSIHAEGPSYLETDLLQLGEFGVSEPNFYISSLDSPWCIGTSHIVDPNGFRDDVLSIGYNVRGGSQTINPADISWFMQFERGYAQIVGGDTHSEFWMGFHHPAHPGDEWRVFGATFNHDLLKGEFSVSGAFSIYGTHENAVPAGNPILYANDGGILETYTGLVIHGDGAGDSTVNRYLRLENVSPATNLQTVQSAPAWSQLGAAWDTNDNITRSIRWDYHFHPISQLVPVGQLSIYESVDGAAGVERVAFIGGAGPGMRFNGSPALVVDAFNELTLGGAGFANTILQGTTVYTAPGGTITVTATGTTYTIAPSGATIIAKGATTRFDTTAAKPVITAVTSAIVDANAKTAILSIIDALKATTGVDIATTNLT